MYIVSAHYIVSQQTRKLVVLFTDLLFSACIACYWYGSTPNPHKLPYKHLGYKARRMHLGIVHGNHTSLKRCNLHHIYYITVMVIKVVEVRYTVHILDMCVGQLRYKPKASSVNREVLLKEAEVSLRRLNLYVCFWKFPVAPLWWGFRSSRALSAA